jgi:O-antigen ligase
MNSSGIQSQGPTEPLSRTLERELVAAGTGAPALRPSTPAPLGADKRLRTAGANSLVVALLSPFLVLSSSKVQRALLALVVLDIPIQLGKVFFLRPYEADLGAVKGLTISMTTLALAGLYLSWVLRALGGRIPRERRPLHFSLPLLLYFSITLLSMVGAQDLELSSFAVFLLFEACLIYFYVANNVRTRADVLFVVSMLLGGCLLEGLIMIVMQFTVTPATNWNLPIHIIAEFAGNTGLMRNGGTIGVPNVAGAYLSILLACAVSLLFTNPGRAHKWLAMAVLGFGGVALIFTFSRGAWIALIVALTVICYSVWHRRGLSLKVPIAVLVVSTLLYLPFHSLISQRLFGDDKGSAEVRIPLMKLAYRVIADNPVRGVGTNNFAVAMDRYLTPEFRHTWLFTVHNKYLLILAETGIGGLLAYLAFLLGTARTGWQCWKLQEPLLSPLALGFVGGIVGNMVHQAVDVFHIRAIQELLWLVAGLLTAMYRISAEPLVPDSLSNASIQK